MTDVNDQTVKVYRGEVRELQFAAEEATGITGWTLSFQVRTTDSATPVLTLTTTGGEIDITDDADGDFTVTLTRSQTAALTRQEYQYDVWRSDSGYHRRLAGGKLLVLKPVYPPP